MFSLKLSIAFFILKASCTYMPELLIDLHRTSVFMLFCLPRFTEWLRSSSWSLGWIICLTNWSGGSIQHLPSCSMVTTRTVTVARWAGTLTADARSGCFKTCCWPFEISSESRAETKRHSPCTPIIGSHLGEGSDPHPLPTQESLRGPSTSLPLFIHLWAWPPTPLQSSRFFLVLFSYLILIDIPSIRFASKNHASGWPPKRTLGRFFFKGRGLMSTWFSSQCPKEPWTGSLDHRPSAPHQFATWLSGPSAMGPAWSLLRILGTFLSAVSSSLLFFSLALSDLPFNRSIWVRVFCVSRHFIWIFVKKYFVFYSLC